MSSPKRALVAVMICMAVAAMAVPARAQDEGRADRSTFNAMWFSIAHPGLGEWYLKGWGSFERCPQKKFWLGFIPIYGWPGYLQVKSAIDARNGRTNDELSFE
jgi:hypothetical protein